MLDRRSLITLAAACLVVAAATAQDAERAILLPLDPAVAPDGKTIVFAWQNDVWRAPVAGGHARRLTWHPAAESQPMLSPDGRTLAFVSDRTGNRQVFVMELDGAAPRQVTFDSSGQQLVGFTDGGASLLVRRSIDVWPTRGEDDRVFVIELAAAGEARKAPRMLVDCGMQDAALSPDGGQLLFTRGGVETWRKGYRGSRAAQLWIADLEATPPALRRLTPDRPNFQNVGEHRPIWAPDGSGYYFTSDPNGVAEVWYRSLDGTEQRRVTTAPDGVDDAVMAATLDADGDCLVFRRLFHLYRCDPATGQAQRLELHAIGDEVAACIERNRVDDARDVAFTPDGKQMAFVAGDDVWVMDAILREPIRLTNDPHRESGLTFSADGRTLWFVSDGGGEVDIHEAKCEQEDGIWWLPDAEIAVQQRTDDPHVEGRLSLSPSGKRLAFVRDDDLWIEDLASGERHRVFESWNTPSFDWSPDERWIVFALEDNHFNEEVWVTRSDGSGEPFNLSIHPSADSQPTWSPDGKRIAFVSRRDSDDGDLYYVNLTVEADEKTERDRKLEKALAAMREGKDDDKDETDSGDEEDAEAGEADSQESDAPPEVRIEFEGIHDRRHRIRVGPSGVSDLVWGPEGKKLYFDTRSGIHAVTFPDDLDPKQVTSRQLSDMRWLKDAKKLGGIVRGGSDSGAPAVVDAKGKVSTYPFTVHQTKDWRDVRHAAFVEGWRAMRDGFYDDRLNDRDWQRVRAKYEPVAMQCLGAREFSTLMNLMLGELNASHLGHSAGDDPLPRVASDDDRWAPRTHHLGLRFDRSAGGPGLRVASVIPRSPCSMARSRVEAGERIVAIDGQPVGPDTDLTQHLNLAEPRDLTLGVRDPDGNERDVVVRPVRSVRDLLYDEWVEANRREVERLSKGRLGYLHIAAMNMSSFRRYQEDLIRAGSGKDGLIIDVRFNGGGSTADHVLTTLTQPEHARTVPRDGGLGYPRSRRVYVSWGKPIVLMCNEYSFSNAEILAHAVKTIGRGRLVGMRTAGGVISTGSRSLLDGSRLRMPFRGWYLTESGQDMELNGCLPDVALWNQPYGPDAQLEAAVRTLAEDVAAQDGDPFEPVPASARRSDER